MAQTRSAAPARRNLSSIIDADSGKMATQGYHYTSMALIPLTPLAFVLSPSSYCLPVDLALGIVIPLHGEFGEGVARPCCSASAAPLLGRAPDTATATSAASLLDPRPPRTPPPPTAPALQPTSA